MFFGLQVDRGNLVQAVADNLLNDLNLTTNRMLPMTFLSVGNQAGLIFDRI